MKVEKVIGVLVLFGFFLGAIVIALRDDTEPDELRSIAGCFESQDLKTKIDIVNNGLLYAGNLEVPVIILRDKDGLSILPRGRLERSSNGILENNYGTPLKIRISDDKNSLTFIDSDELVLLKRYDCK